MLFLASARQKAIEFVGVSTRFQRRQRLRLVGNRVAPQTQLSQRVGNYVKFRCGGQVSAAGRPTARSQSARHPVTYTAVHVTRLRRIYKQAEGHIDIYLVFDQNHSRKVI